MNTNPDPICAAPTRAELVRNLWATHEPLKDGSAIVAIGRVIIKEDDWTSVNPLSLIHI